MKNEQFQGGGVFTYMRWFLILSVLLICSACPKPVSTNDRYLDRASLPRDEAVHPKNSLEWWYFTGVLQEPTSGREFGVEYVFFHFNPRDKHDYLMVNVALSDIDNGRFIYDYKMVKLDSLLSAELPINLNVRYKNETWTFSGQEGRYHLQATMVQQPHYGLNLNTEPTTDAWMHGGGTGYQQYGAYAKAGYYSYPRLQTKGHLKVDGMEIPVEGTLWYDRQWNCIGVYQKEVAWDWMSLAFPESGSSIMLFKLYHRTDGRIIYGGSFKDAEGNNIPLSARDVIIEERDWWQSRESNIRYPVEWRVQLPAFGYDLNVKARFPQQELTLKFNAFVKLHYWEGTCTVIGTHHGQPVQGDSYVEITNRRRK